MLACLLAYACCTLVAHGHWWQDSISFCFVTYVPDRDIYKLPISISAINYLLQVFLGLPLLCFPCVFHCRACLVMPCFGFLSLCSIHPHIFSFSTGINIYGSYCISNKTSINGGNYALYWLTVKELVIFSVYQTLPLYPLVCS